MDNNEIIIDLYELPKPLSNAELIDLIIKMNNGNAWARDKIILYNLRLVYFEINSKFKSIEYDKNDLASLGILGLIKAVDTYDLNKGYKFTTYATRCIDNEILMFLRHLKKEKYDTSLNSILYYFKENDGALLENTLATNYDLVTENETRETYQIVRNIIQTLPDREKQIILLNFGFINDQVYSQREIAQKLNLSQSYVSRLLTKAINTIKTILITQGVVEVHTTPDVIKKSQHLKKK